MSTIWRQKQSPHEAVLYTGVIDDAELRDKISPMCVMLDMSDSQFVMFTIEAGLFWIAARPNRIAKMVGSTENVSPRSLQEALILPCKCVHFQLLQAILRHFGQQPVNDQSAFDSALTVKNEDDLLDVLLEKSILN